MTAAPRAFRTPAPRLAVLIPISFALALAASIARAQTQSTLPTEDFRWQRTVPAGPYSAVNTATNTLVTSIPLVHFTGPGGTALDFSITHVSGATGYTSYIGQIARKWRHS